MVDVPIAWGVPAYLPCVQPPLTDAVLADAEQRLQLRLPAAYVAALRVQNGGYLRHAWPDYAEAMLWGIGPRWPSILGGSLAQRHPPEEGWLPPHADRLFPFAGDGHWYLCFDARAGRDEPAIAYIDLECAHERPAAASFSELARALGPRDDVDRVRVGITTATTIEDAAKRLGRALRMKVTDQGDWAYGYRTVHGLVKRGSARSQFWVTPNEVPRGFVRPDHPEYAVLVGSLPGTALRYPEHPDCPLLVDSDALASDALLAACERAALRARLLTPCSQ